MATVGERIYGGGIYCCKVLFFRLLVWWQMKEPVKKAVVVAEWNG